MKTTARLGVCCGVVVSCGGGVVECLLGVGVEVEGGERRGERGEGRGRESVDRAKRGGLGCVAWRQGRRREHVSLTSKSSA